MPLTQQILRKASVINRTSKLALQSKHWNRERLSIPKNACYYSSAFQNLPTGKRMNNHHHHPSYPPLNFTRIPAVAFSTDSNSNVDSKEVKKESLEFQAETRQLLDIVTHSLYTDKEVFLRELISNASDALEKLRHLQAANELGGATIDPDVPMEIRVDTDEVNGTLTISDTGIGMTKDEMISNLGTIARSGSKAFVSEMASRAEGDPSSDVTKGIIGKFGVGFYSAFMVGEKVEVRSRYVFVFLKARCIELLMVPSKNALTPFS